MSGVSDQKMANLPYKESSCPIVIHPHRPCDRSVLHTQQSTIASRFRSDLACPLPAYENYKPCLSCPSRQSFPEGHLGPYHHIATSPRGMHNGGHCPVSMEFYLPTLPDKEYCPCGHKYFHMTLIFLLHKDAGLWDNAPRQKHCLHTLPKIKGQTINSRAKKRQRHGPATVSNYHLIQKRLSADFISASSPQEATIEEPLETKGTVIPSEELYLRSPNIQGYLDQKMEVLRKP